MILTSRNPNLSMASISAGAITLIGNGLNEYYVLADVGKWKLGVRLRLSRTAKSDKVKS